MMALTDERGTVCGALVFTEIIVKNYSFLLPSLWQYVDLYLLQTLFHFK